MAHQLKPVIYWLQPRWPNHKQKSVMQNFISTTPDTIHKINLKRTQSITSHCHSQSFHQSSIGHLCAPAPSIPARGVDLVLDLIPGMAEDGRGAAAAAMALADGTPARAGAMLAGAAAARWCGKERPVAGLAESGAPRRRELLAVVGAGRAPREVVEVCWWWRSLRSRSSCISCWLRLPPWEKGL